MNEQEMREAKVPWPETMEELTSYINSLASQPHDYGTAVYAMSMAAVATYYFMSHVVGASGFQASCADLDIIRRVRGFEGPFGLIDSKDMLYPQYDILKKVSRWLKEWEPWAGEEAARRLKEDDGFAHPDVRAHWTELRRREILFRKFDL